MNPLSLATNNCTPSKLEDSPVMHPNICVFYSAWQKFWSTWNSTICPSPPPTHTLSWVTAWMVLMPWAQTFWVKTRILFFT